MGPKTGKKPPEGFPEALHGGISFFLCDSGTSGGGFLKGEALGFLIVHSAFQKLVCIASVELY